MNNNNKTNSYRVRPVAPVPAPATSQVVYDIPFSSLVEAWIDCERNKRSSPSMIKLRWHVARVLHETWVEMITGKYKPRMSMTFIIFYPVLREVWAGAARDRVVHHWEAARFGPVLEDFIVKAGNKSMNCRKGYGALKAVEALSKMIYDFTDGYTREDCFILGGDYANYFMSIDKDILWPCLEYVMRRCYKGEDKEALLYMMKTTLYNKCSENYYRRSPIEHWKNLPKRKSLFYMNGIPIGDYTSQLWANFYGAIPMYWLMEIKGYKDLLMFVDDWRALVRAMLEGRELWREYSEWVWENLHIEMHPDKVYLQHFRKGTKIVGAVIKPGRVYISNRTRGHFITTLIGWNAKAEKATESKKIDMLHGLRASVNSYLGMMIHYKTYKIRKKICEEYILPVWGKYVYFPEGYTKMIIRRQYDNTYRLRKRLRSHSFARKFLRPKWREQ